MMHTSSRALIIIVLTLFITPSTERNFEKIVGGGALRGKTTGRVVTELASKCCGVFSSQASKHPSVLAVKIERQIINGIRWRSR